MLRRHQATGQASPQERLPWPRQTPTYKSNGAAVEGTSCCIVCSSHASPSSLPTAAYMYGRGWTSLARAGAYPCRRVCARSMWQWAWPPTTRVTPFAVAATSRSLRIEEAAGRYGQARPAISPHNRRRLERAAGGGVPRLDVSLRLEHGLEERVLDARVRKGSDDRGGYVGLPIFSEVHRGMMPRRRGRREDRRIERTVRVAPADGRPFTHRPLARHVCQAGRAGGAAPHWLSGGPGRHVRAGRATPRRPAGRRNGHVRQRLAAAAVVYLKILNF